MRRRLSYVNARSNCHTLSRRVVRQLDYKPPISMQAYGEDELRQILAIRAQEEDVELSANAPRSTTDPLLTQDLHEALPINACGTSIVSIAAGNIVR